MTANAILKACAFIFVFLVLVHWLTAGTDEIVEGPPETPDHSLIQPATTP